MEEHLEGKACAPTPEGRGGPGGRPHGHGPERCSGGRIAAYWCCMVVLNLLLAIFALYVLAYVMEFDWRFLSVATVETIAKAVFQLLILFSPLLLTIFLHRLLYRIFRGRRRFPRGTGTLVVLVVLLVQGGALWFLLQSSGVVDVTALQIHSLGSIVP